MKQDRSKRNTAAPRPRPGRPRADQVGEVDRRILEAATAVFLEQGFGRTSLDHIAEKAHTSKTTLYGRYSSKEDLFEAVVQECVGTFLQKMGAGDVHGTLEQKLTQVGTALAQATLTPYVISIMRITLAETVHFPELAREAFRLGFGACVQSIADALRTSDDPVICQNAVAIGQRFVELALHPLYFHAFFGTSLDELHQRIAMDVAQVARMLARELGDSVENT